MARFSNQFLQSLGNPSYSQGLFDLGKNIAGTPMLMKQEEERKKQQASVSEMLKNNSDNAPLLNAQALKYQAQGNDELAKVFSTAAQQAVTRSTRRGEIADKSRERADIRAEAVGKKVDAQGAELQRYRLEQNARSVARKTIGDPNKLQATEARLKGATAEELKTFLTNAGKTKEDAKFGATVTEWVDDQGNVVLKSIQREDGKSYELGNTSAALTEDSFKGLTRREKTGVSVNVGGKTESAYGAEIAKQIATADTTAIEAGRSGANTLGTISEARLVLAENPEVLGIGGELIDATRKGMSRLMSGLGVDPSDPTFKQITEQNSAADMYRAFQQDFVRPRMEATKGAISDREYSSFLASVPGLLSTPEGYKEVLDFMERASTAAVLKGNSIEEAIGSETPRASAKAARDEWTKFSSDFPLGSLPPKAMTDIWGDYSKEGFNKDNMMFMVTTPDGSVKQTSYKTIVNEARKRGIPSSLAIKQAFRDYGVSYLPMSQ